jgi:hypothetical protein
MKAKLLESGWALADKLEGHVDFLQEKLLELYVLSYSYRQLEIFSVIQSRFLENKEFSPRNIIVWQPVVRKCVEVGDLELTQYFLENYRKCWNFSITIEAGYLELTKLFVENFRRYSIGKDIVFNLIKYNDLSMWRLFLNHYQKMLVDSLEDLHSNISDWTLIQANPLIIFEWIRKLYHCPPISVQYDSFSIIVIQFSILGINALHYLFTLQQEEAARGRQFIGRTICHLISNSTEDNCRFIDKILATVVEASIDLIPNLSTSPIADQGDYAGLTLIEIAARKAMLELISVLIKKGTSRTSRLYEALKYLDDEIKKTTNPLTPRRKNLIVCQEKISRHLSEIDERNFSMNPAQSMYSLMTSFLSPQNPSENKFDDSKLDVSHCRIC